MMAIRRIAVETDVYNRRLLLSIVCILALYNEVGPGTNEVRGRSLGLPLIFFYFCILFNKYIIYIYIHMYISTTITSLTLSISAQLYQLSVPLALTTTP